MQEKYCGFCGFLINCESFPDEYVKQWHTHTHTHTNYTHNAQAHILVSVHIIIGFFGGIRIGQACCTSTKSVVMK